MSLQHLDPGQLDDGGREEFLFNLNFGVLKYGGKV